MLLLEPFSSGRLSLNNRVVMAPMTRNRTPEGLATPLMAEYYAQRASAGLIITEGAQISPQGVGYPATPGIHSQAQAANWRQVTDAVHARGGRIFIQLWHCGRVSHPDFHGGELPVAPSAIAPQGQAFTWEGMKDFVTPRALDISELAGIVNDYRQAAALAMEAGFDGVEIHAANGYLLDQFLRDGSNQRHDAYGQTIEGRCRLLLEVTEAVCQQIGCQRVGVRLSPVNQFNDMHESQPQITFTHAAAALGELQPLYLHVVEVDMTGQSSTQVDMRQLRRSFRGLYIANGGYDDARASQALASHDADLVSFGMPFIANPDLVERFRRHAPLNTADQATFYGGDAHGYTDYPTLDHSPVSY